MLFIELKKFNKQLKTLYGPTSISTDYLNPPGEKTKIKKNIYIYIMEQASLIPLQNTNIQKLIITNHIALYSKKETSVSWIIFHLTGSSKNYEGFTKGCKPTAPGHYKMGNISALCCIWYFIFYLLNPCPFWLWHVPLVPIYQSSIDWNCSCVKFHPLPCRQISSTVGTTSMKSLWFILLLVFLFWTGMFSVFPGIDSGLGWCGEPISMKRGSEEDIRTVCGTFLIGEILI